MKIKALIYGSYIVSHTYTVNFPIQLPVTIYSNNYFTSNYVEYVFNENIIKYICYRAYLYSLTSLIGKGVRI